MSNELNSDDAACIGSDMSLTITERNLVKRIAQLEADKAELVEALKLCKPALRYESDDVNDTIESLIQKHAAK